jgi:phospholipid-translocating ATPase
VPADIVIISTSEPENLCFVETKNLDGETNLKVKRGIQELAHIKTPTQCSKAKFVIDSESPDPNLYTYNAVAILKPQDSSEIFVPISADGILLRGCFVRNTAWVIGVVVFTGKDSKIMLNAGATPTKRSRIDRQINPQVCDFVVMGLEKSSHASKVMLNFVILIGMCLICGLAAAIFEVAFKIEDSSYIGGVNTNDRDAPEITAILSTFRCMIIFQNIIPIALYISIDIAKTVQSYFIHSDSEMYDEETDTPAVCQSWKLCDDLGMDIIFNRLDSFADAKKY